MLELLRYFRLFRRRGLFDRAFYLKKYPDLTKARVDPLRHYLMHGAAEGRKPHPLFDPNYYLRRNPEAQESRNALAHFLEKGGANGMSPHPLFDCEAYLRTHPDAAAKGANPLVDHLQNQKHARVPFAAEGSQFGCAS